MIYRVLLAVFIAVPLVNFATPLLPGGDEQFADYGSTRVDAAPYAFSIWFVIFFGMLGFSWRLVREREPNTVNLRSACGGLIVAGLASIAFVPISLYASDVWSLIDILVHLFALSYAAFHLQRFVSGHPKGSAGRWWFYAPSMYLGWISAATVISAALAADALGIELRGPWATVIACTTLGAVATIAGLMIRAGDPIYAATIVWGLVAIGVQQAAYPPVRWTAWIAAAIVAALTVFKLARAPRFYALAATENG